MSGRKVLLVLALLGLFWTTACTRHQHKPPDLSATQEPDKVLFQRAMEDIDHGKYDVARLTLQTLINTYPDSEYLAKAKLAIADSYYKEGGTSGLAQAEAEYKDFITFFPTAPEAPEAQMKIAMAHYRQMEKPDRDRMHMKRAEDEFRTLLLQYPDSPYAAEAEQRLREVQEVLAEGDFRVARFYYIKGSNRAALTRLKDVVDRYPNYSHVDQTLLMLGDLIQRAFHKERGKDAAVYYKRIITDYPLSNYVEQAKKRLTEMGEAIPQPKPEALARAQLEKQQLEKLSIFGRMRGALHRAPDVSGAKGKVGKPALTPPEPQPAQAPPPSETGGGGGTSLGIAVQTVPQTSSGVSVGTATTVPNPPPATTTSPSPGASSTPPSGAAAGSGQPAPATAGGADSQQASAEKPAEEGDKKVKESSSRKRSIFRRLIPFGGKEKKDQ